MNGRPTARGALRNLIPLDRHSRGNERNGALAVDAAEAATPVSKQQNKNADHHPEVTADSDGEVQRPRLLRQVSPGGRSLQWLNDLPDATCRPGI